MKNFKISIINSIYLLAVLVISLIISSFGMARKINLYRKDASLMDFVVKKDEVIISTATEGIVVNIQVKLGQYVQAGDVVVEITDPLLSAQLDTLERYQDVNLSAQTQAEVLRSQRLAHKITALRSGYVQEIFVSEGSMITKNQQIISIIATDGMLLKAQLSVENIEYLQKIPNLELYSKRLEQTYSAEYESVNQVDSSQDSNLYTTYFTINGEDGVKELLDDEQLVVLSYNKQAHDNRPANIITKAWNTLLVTQ